jgi:hypothetical protein
MSRPGGSILLMNNVDNWRLPESRGQIQRRQAGYVGATSVRQLRDADPAIALHRPYVNNVPRLDGYRLETRGLRSAVRTNVARWQYDITYYFLALRGLP